MAQGWLTVVKERWLTEQLVGFSEVREAGGELMLGMFAIGMLAQGSFFHGAHEGL